jgi:hypothetical protein
MAGQYWLVWAALSASAALGIGWHYRRRETAGRGRLLLAALRAAAVAMLLLLLFDPELPARRGEGGGRGVQVVLDASLSMGVAAPGERSRWQEGARTALARSGGRPVLLFGERVRAASAGALPDTVPGDPRSQLLPALQAAAEAGVRRVVVVTDGGIEDAAAVARWLPRLGVEVEWEVVGDVVANRSVVEVAAPQWVEAGAPVAIEVAVAGAGAGGASVRARIGERVIGRATVAAAEEGRLATGTVQLRLEAPPGGGWVPVVVELEDGDAVPDDDRRTVYIHVAAETAGIVLVSLRPDWEPRFLAPALEQALGLPVRGYLRGTADGWVRLGGGLDAGAPASEADVRSALGRAELLVLHGVGDDAPAWILDALQRAPRILVFPAGSITGLPVEVGPLAEGDWFPAPDLPPSPVAPLLAGQEMAGVAPLNGLRSVTVPAGSWTPLLVSRGRQGQPQPAVVAGQTGGRRWAVAPASGYWQWSFRGGEERQLYARLWGAVGGWLVRERGTAPGEAVRPAKRASPRGIALGWVVPGLPVDSLAVALTGSDGAVALDTVVTFTAADTAFVAPPPPGDYSYRVRAFSGDTVSAAAGELTVESWSPEFVRPRADVRALGAGGSIVRAGADTRRPGTPLHTTPWPYVLLVLLLAAEWILRRRWGLR